MCGAQQLNLLPDPFITVAPKTARKQLSHFTALRRHHALRSAIPRVPHDPIHSCGTGQKRLSSVSAVTLFAVPPCALRDPQGPSKPSGRIALSCKGLARVGGLNVCSVTLRSLAGLVDQPLTRFDQRYPGSFLLSSVQFSLVDQQQAVGGK